MARSPLDPSPRAIRVSGATARGEGRSGLPGSAGILAGELLVAFSPARMPELPGPWPHLTSGARRFSLPMILLLDIGNTHTHLGLATRFRVRRHLNIPTAGWFDGSATRRVRRFVGQTALHGITACSVVPQVTVRAMNAVE